MRQQANTAPDARHRAHLDLRLHHEQRHRLEDLQIIVGVNPATGERVTRLCGKIGIVSLLRGQLQERGTEIVAVVQGDARDGLVELPLVVAAIGQLDLQVLVDLHAVLQCVV